jgi:acetyltransferase
MSDLAVFFRPRGVAVIGASGDQDKLGHSVVRNLRNVHYEGPVYPVNPHEEEILGYKAYPTILDVPAPVELAVVIVPAPIVAREVEACGKRGVKAAIIVSGGFREMGSGDGGVGAGREHEVRRIAKQYGVRLLGPNCMGTIDTHTPLNTTFMDSVPHQGNIAFVSQSGAMVAAVMDWGAGSGVGFSRIVSLGNQADITVAEMLGQGILDEHTRVVTGYIEGVEDGWAFIEAARDVARKLPVVFLKAGRGKSGARAVASHTGALAGATAVYQAAFRRAGVLWASTMEELVDWGRALAWQPLPQGNRVAILTSAGGPAILAADALEQAGMQLAPLTAETKAFLRARVFANASVDNPVDTLAGSGPATYALCLDALLADETVDAVVVIQAPQDWFKPASLAEVVGEVANSRLGRRKPLLTVIMGEASGSEATQILHRRRIPNYAFPERVGGTLAAMWWRKQWLDELEAADDEERTTIVRGPEGAPLIEDRIRDSLTPIISHSAGGWMPAEHVDALLAAYGIRTPPGGLAKNVEGALELAKRFGYPVALKLALIGISHKTDLGGVALNVATPEQLQSHFEAMVESARSIGTVEGIYVQRMVKPLAELIVGVVRDPQFGPLVMAGAGGVEVELKRDVAFELAPLSARQADDLLSRTGARSLLAGYRGKPPADRSAVTDAILRLSQIALDWPEIEEIEINPLIAMEQGDGEGAVAVDARVRLAMRNA